MGPKLGGNGYRIALRAIDPVPGTTLSEARAKAASKGDVLQAMGSVAAKIRVALGDAKSETEKITADESFTAASLEASRDYSTAQGLASGGKDEEAVALYKSAIGHDAKFGRAYSGWAMSANRLGRREESLEQWKKALELLDRMSERERYRTQASYFSQVMRNYEKAVETNTVLVQKYPADGMAHNNLAVAHFNLLNFEKSREEGQKAVQLYPKTALFRYNYALYAMYVGDFATAEKEAKAALEINPQTFKAYLALAMAALVSGDAKGAQDVYAQAREKGGRAASLASIGLADVAMYQGRYGDAEPLLTAGVAADEAVKNTSGAALKYAALAELYLAQHKTAAAVNAAQRAMRVSRSNAVLVPAARVLTAAGKETEARALAAELDAQLQPLQRAYGKLIIGEIALQRGRIPDAVDAFLASQQFVDYSSRGGNKGYWLSRYDARHRLRARGTLRRGAFRIRSLREAAGRSDRGVHGRCAVITLCRGAAILAGPCAGRCSAEGGRARQLQEIPEVASARQRRSARDRRTAPSDQPLNANAPGRYRRRPSPDRE